MSTAIPIFGSSGINRRSPAHRAWSIGCSFSAIAANLTTNSVYPGSSRPGGEAALYWSRRFTRFVASTVVLRVTGAVADGSRPSARRSSGASGRSGRTSPGIERRPVRLGAADDRPDCGREDVDLSDPAGAAAAEQPRPVDAELARSRRASGEIRGRSPRRDRRPRPRLGRGDRRGDGRPRRDHSAGLPERFRAARPLPGRGGIRSPCPRRRCPRPAASGRRYGGFPASLASMSWVAFSPSRVKSGSPARMVSPSCLSQPTKTPSPCSSRAGGW